MYFYKVVCRILLQRGKGRFGGVLGEDTDGINGGKGFNKEYDERFSSQNPKSLSYTYYSLYHIINGKFCRGWSPTYENIYRRISTES